MCAQTQDADISFLLQLRSNTTTPCSYLVCAQTQPYPTAKGLRPYLFAHMYGTAMTPVVVQMCQHEL
jgi:hypothetical protein